MPGGGVTAKRSYPCPDVPDGCSCRCHSIRAAMGRRKRERRDVWLARHTAALRELVAAGETPAAIAVALSERFHVPRSESAVRRRLRILGLSTRDGWWSREDLIRMLGVSERRMLQFEAQSDIAETRYGRWRRYRGDDVERLIREQAGKVIDPRRVKNPAWRSLAEVSAIANMRTG